MYTRWTTPGTTNTYRDTGKGGKQCTFRTRGKINLIVSEIEFTRAVRLSRSSSGTTKSLTMLSRCPNRGGDTRAQPLAYRASKCTQHDAFVLVICARVSRTFWPVVYGKLYPTLCSNIEMFPGKMSFSRPVDIYVDSVLQCIHRENNGNSSFSFYKRISNASISYEEIIEINKNVIFNILNIIFFKYINSYCCTSLISNRS